MKDKDNRGNSVTVTIDDTKFDTIGSAAEFLDIHKTTLGNILRDNEEHIVKGFKVKRITEVRPPHQYGYIYCKRTGKLYSNAAELAESLHAKACTISAGLKKGWYIDKFNNCWTRISKRKAAELLAGHELNENIPQPKVKEDVSTPALIKTTSKPTKKTTIQSNTLTTKCEEIENDVQDLLHSLIQEGKYAEAHKTLDALANLKQIFDEVE